MYMYKFYHNDLNLGNILVKNCKNPIEIRFPWSAKRYILKLNNMPFLKLIDFDLSTTKFPRDNNFNLQNTTQIPIIDLIYFLMKFLNNISKIKTIEETEFIENLKTELNRFNLFSNTRAIISIENMDNSIFKPFIERIVEICMIEIGDQIEENPENIFLHKPNIMRSKSLKIHKKKPYLTRSITYS